MKHQFRFVIGDWSNDGHNYHQEFAYKANYPVHVLQKAYIKSCKKVGLQFNINDDYTGLVKPGYSDKTYDHNKSLCMFCEYEQHSLTTQQVEVLSKSGIKANTRRYTKRKLIALLIDFLRVSLPDLECEEIKGLDKKKLGKYVSDYPPFNGWWCKGLNQQIGYGLWTFPGLERKEREYQEKKTTEIMENLIDRIKELKSQGD